MVFLKFGSFACQRISSQRCAGSGGVANRKTTGNGRRAFLPLLGLLSVWLCALLRASQLRRSENPDSP
jgi:hypothetical protein